MMSEPIAGIVVIQMTKETKQSPHQEAPTSNSRYVPSRQRLTDLGWQAANLSTAVVVTSGLIVVVQSPLNSLMANFMKSGVAIPSASLRAGWLAAVRSLYAGTLPHLGGTTMRSAYVTGSRRSITEEGGQERPMSATKQTGFVGAMALGDVIITQIPDTKSKLAKFGVKEYPMNLNNVTKLATTGIGARFSSSFANYGALCMVTDFYARKMTFIPDGKLRHGTAGLLSGMTAAAMTCPIGIFRDHVLSKANAGANGKLLIPGMLTVAKEFYAYVKHAGIVEASERFAREFAVQAPLRMCLTGVTFAILATVEKTLGARPLEKYGFFATSPAIAVPEVDEKPSPKP